MLFKARRAGASFQVLLSHNGGDAIDGEASTIPAEDPPEGLPPFREICLRRQPLRRREIKSDNAGEGPPNCGRNGSAEWPHHRLVTRPGNNMGIIPRDLE